jgi:hypothetical protein
MRQEGIERQDIVTDPSEAEESLPIQREPPFADVTLPDDVERETPPADAPPDVDDQPAVERE